MKSFKQWLNVNEAGDFDSMLSGAIQGKTALFSADPKIGGNASAIADKINKDREVQDMLSKAKLPVNLDPSKLQKSVQDQIKKTKDQQNKIQSNVVK